ncbi:hypothetical protein Bca4012_023445 [Brassica carinata]
MCDPSTAKNTRVTEPFIFTVPSLRQKLNGAYTGTKRCFTYLHNRDSSHGEHQSTKPRSHPDYQTTNTELNPEITNSAFITLSSSSESIIVYRDLIPAI